MNEQEEMNAVLDELSTEFLNDAMPMALAEGWPEEMAEIFAVNALELFLEDALANVPADEAFDSAMEETHFLMMENIFVNALEEGQSRRDAFMMLLAVESKLAENRGEPETRFPIEWIDSGVAAVEAAAAENQPVTRQIIAGFEAFRTAAGAALEAGKTDAGQAARTRSD